MISSKIGVIGDNSYLPIRKWPGVRTATSFMPPDNGHKGFEFNDASISVNNVYSAFFLTRNIGFHVLNF